jgi:hypothetical protein
MEDVRLDDFFFDFIMYFIYFIVNYFIYNKCLLQ